LDRDNTVYPLILVSRTYGDFHYTGVDCVESDTVSSPLYQDAVYTLVRRICRSMRRSMRIDCRNALGRVRDRDRPILFFDTRIDTSLKQQRPFPFFDITIIGRIHWSYVSRGCIMQDGFSDSMVIENSCICMSRNEQEVSWIGIVRELLHIFDYHSDEVTSLHVHTLYRIIPLLRMGTCSL